MPIFEYRCLGCGKIFEVFTQRQELSAAPKCPDCGKTEGERVFSAFSAPNGGSGGCSTSSLGFG